MKKTLLSLCVTATLSTSAFGDSTLVDDFRLDITAPAYAGSSPAVVCDSIGNFVVVWVEKCEDSCRIMARSFLPSGQPANDIQHLETTRPEAVIRAAGSTHGAFILTWYQSVPGAEIRTELLSRRYSWDLDPVEGYPTTITDSDENSTTYRITSCASAIDRSGNAFIAYTRRNEDTYAPDLAVVHLTHDGEMSLWSYGGNKDLEYALPSCSFSGPNRVTILFSQNKYRVMEGYTHRALSRVIGFANSETSPSDGFHELRRFEYPISHGEWHLAGAGLEKWNRSIVAFNDSIGIRFARLDSNGARLGELLTLSLNETPDSWNISNYNDLSCAAGPSGAYAIVRSQPIGHYSGIVWLHWADSLKQNPIHELEIGRGNSPEVAVDGMRRKLVVWERNGGVYLQRIGRDPLEPHRINGAGVEPKLLAVDYLQGYGSGKSLYAAWNYGDNETIALSRREWYSSPSWPAWTVSFSGIPHLGLPQLARNDHSRIAVAYLRRSGSTDTTLMLTVRSAVDGSVLVENRVNDNGTSPGAADVAVNGNRILTIWEDRRAQHGDTSYLYGQFFDSDGGIVGGNFPVSPGSRPSLCVTDSGRYGLAFTVASVAYSQIPGGPVIRRVSSSVYFSRLTSDGEIHTAPTKVNTSTANASQPQLCPLGNGILVVWSESGTGTSKVYGRRYVNGTPVSAPTKYSDDNAARQPSVCGITDSCAVVAWYSSGSELFEYAAINKHGEMSGEIKQLNSEPVTGTLPSPTMSGDSDKVFFGWIDKSAVEPRAVGKLVQIQLPGSSPVIPNRSPAFTSSKPGPRQPDASVLFDVRGRRVPLHRIHFSAPGILLEVRSDDKVLRRRAIPTKRRGN